LKRLREADGTEMNEVAMEDGIEDIIGELGTENVTTGGTIDDGVE
jgi:hypothetical protein